MGSALAYLFLYIIADVLGYENYKKCPGYATKDIRFNRNFTRVMFDPKIFHDQVVNYLFEDGDDMRVIFEKVSSKFDHVGVILRSSEEPLFIQSMFKDIANLNVVGGRMKVTIFLDLSSEIDKIRALLQLILNITYPIYPGTVETLLVRIDRIDVNSLKQFKEILKIFHKLREESKYNYQIGVLISLNDCNSLSKNSQGNVKFTNLFREILTESYDMIYLQKTISISHPIETDFITNQVRMCNDTVQRYRDVIPLGFHVRLRGSHTKGIVNYSKFINFWKSMDTFARENQIPTLIAQAFDIPDADLDEGETGWWRIVPKAYNHSSDLIFEDKLCLKDKTFGSELETVNLTWLKNDHRFEGKTSVSLLLSTWQDISSKHGSPGSIQAFKLILSKFATITLILNAQEEDEIGTSDFLKLYKKMEANKSVDILLFLSLPSNTNVKKVADAANKIAPGRAKRIILNKDEQIHKGNEEDLKNFLNTIENGKSAEYKYGLGLPINRCSKRILKNIKGYSINFVLFQSIVPVTKMGVGAEAMAMRQQAIFLSCTKQVKKFIRVEVMFLTGWPTSEVADYLELITYWQLMGEWAEENGVEIIFYSAFDYFDSPHPNENYGWWKMDNLNKDLFKSKREVAFKQALELQSRINSDKPKFEILVILLIIAFLLTSSIVITVRFLRVRNLKYLTKADLAKFFDGSLDDLLGAGYDKALELEPTVFQVNENDILGSGAFGQVCTGIIKQDEISVNVAVKMASNCSRIALCGLLSEIKVLAYLGKHPNIVELMGAYTAELKRNVAYVFLEICGLGSLETFLRKWEEMNGKDLDGEEKLISDMGRWALEIASGMEYISSKNVVHMDLATRNVLLTSNKTAKISDFGLSRRLYNYEMYVKTKQEPLPWRWMSPESLRRREFTEKSDVWAYGVTLWEIYSLGDIPYQGIAWNVNFVNFLDNGLRLNVPKYKVENYSLMSKCWNAVPELRPTFSQIKSTLLND